MYILLIYAVLKFDYNQMKLYKVIVIVVSSFHIKHQTQRDGP